MGGRIKFSFHVRILLLVLVLFWIMVGAFMMFQYGREKEFKQQLLNTELQMFNTRLIEEMSGGKTADEALKGIKGQAKGLRVTIVDRSGRVVFDNNDRTPFPSTNHNSRPEIAEARKKGAGFTVERHSESDKVDYFYSATLAANGNVLRSAARYDHSLEEMLSADRSILWIMFVIMAVMSLAAYFVTRKISWSIRRLNRFAERAEKGEPIFSDEEFPHDELGSIASHIVRLYVQRDQRHREALKQQSDKIRLKKQLTNNINHELKTPVSSILVCLELLRDHPDLPEDKRKDFTAKLYANALRLSALLKDISLITRMDEGERLVEKGPLEITRIVNEVADEARMRTAMQISVDMPQLSIKGNHGLIESIFRNLIDNSIAYSGGTEISISADKEGNFIFRDNGNGIPEEHLPHIFERFYRIDKGRSRASGGTGLGLSIVRNAVAIHGGKIRVSNDSGLRFDFSLSLS